MLYSSGRTINGAPCCQRGASIHSGWPGRRIVLGAMLAATLTLATGCADDGRPTQADTRAAVEARLRVAWDRMARGDGAGSGDANAKAMAGLLQLAELSTTNFERQADGSWTVSVTYFLECHGKTPNLRFRLRCTGAVVMVKDSGAWTVRKFQEVTGDVVAGGAGDPEWGT